VLTPAPALDEYGDVVARPAVVSGPRADAGPAALPLAGVTVLEMGVMYAAPFGPTLLADLGARVIKIEPLDGDAIRNLMPFPESAGAKVMQGKESIALDINTADGLQIVHELARRSDIVMQGFRAGAATRIGVDAATLTALNPDLVYVNAPGYGTDGPFGHRPAYAPSIGAAAGLALADFPGAEQQLTDIEDVKRAAAQLNTATAIPAVQADGIAALGVASTLLLGLLARARGAKVGELTATMIGTNALANLDRVIDYDDRPASPTVDTDGYGLGPLYRLYPAADGWVFLAAPSAAEAGQLFDALGPHSSTALGDLDDAELVDALTAIFATRPAADWERDLTAADVGCVRVHEGCPQVLLQVDPALAAEYAVAATSPVFDEHLRPGPSVLFSRSLTRAEGFCLCGEDTDALLAELGYTVAQINELRGSKTVA
jgi:crotonobetainyl-CoA:carnitine CoA-transferase CaiB-like acyl-CoA transferase